MITHKIRSSSLLSFSRTCFMVRRFCSSTSGEGTFRRPFQKNHPDFYNEEKLEQEMRRVFDVCHGCRACFNLCESFPTLFEMVDSSPSQELDTVPSSEFSKVVDDCTLCDMCFMVTCPYVPPHSLDIDFPHLIARYKAVEFAKNYPDQKRITEEGKKEEFVWPNKNEKLPVEEGISLDLKLRKNRPSPLERIMSQTDIIGYITGPFSAFTNRLLQSNTSFRSLLRYVAGIHPNADLPSYVTPKEQFGRVFDSLPRIESSRTENRKVLLYGTCLSQYNRPEIGISAKRVLERNGVEVEFAYGTCCGMPQFESGDLSHVERQAKQIVNSLLPKVKQGYQVVSVVASCSLMMKKEWPLLMPNDSGVELVSKNTFDISEYMMKIEQTDGVDKEIDEEFAATISLHNACHNRAQNIGFKSRDMLKLFKKKGNLDVKIVQRCSGHGGIWGARDDKFEKAMKVGKPAISQVIKHQKAADKKHIIVSDCPLAAMHLAQGVEMKEKESPSPNCHPIEVVAMAYGFHPSQSKVER